MAADVDADDTNGTALATADTDGSFTSLYDKVKNGGTVTLDNDYKYSSGDEAYKNGINITKNLVLNGNGNIVIDGDKQARIFNIEEGITVTLKGITFKNGNATGNGGAINSLGVLNVENCKFINNTANFLDNDTPGHGGAIYLDHSTSSDIKGTTLLNVVVVLCIGVVTMVL